MAISKQWPKARAKLTIDTSHCQILKQHKGKAAFYCSALQDPPADQRAKVICPWCYALYWRERGQANGRKKQ